MKTTPTTPGTGDTPRPASLPRDIIACMDIKDGMVSKGVRFEDVEPLEDPVTLARYYQDEQVDVLVIYDITAAIEHRQASASLIQGVRAVTDRPLMLGGGLHTMEDLRRARDLGIDRFSINSGALNRPEFLTEAAEAYGSEAVLLAVDARRVGDEYHIFSRGGRDDTGIRLTDWLAEGERRGAGGVVLNAIDADGVREGYDLEMLQVASDACSLPLIASGGAGKPEHFREVFRLPAVHGALAASIFHRKVLRPSELRAYLDKEGVRRG